MITEKDFCDATSVWNGHEIDELGWVCEPDDVVWTADTLEHFIEASGPAFEKVNTPPGILYVWENQQSRKGKARGNLFVMDAGDHRWAYFNGEV